MYKNGMLLQLINYPTKTMIRKVRFNNFYSFKDEQEINFLANKKNSYSYANIKSKENITKIAAFIGGNASGKTNIMRLFSFLSYFVCMSSKDDTTPLNSIVFKTFYNNKSPSNFYIEYEDDNKIYFYELRIQNNVVLKEELKCKEIAKNAKRRKLFLREKDNLTYLNKLYFKNFSKKFVMNIRLDVSLIAFLKSHYNIDVINHVYDYFLKFKTNINERGEISNPAHQIKTLELYLKVDLGLSGFEIKKEINKESFKISVTGLHTIKEKSYKLDFIYESRGTQSLFFTLANIFTAIKNNAVVVIDEIELGLHPEALNKLVSYIIDENKNKRAQIIFSSHSLRFIKKLDMHQLFLTEKDEHGNSIVYRLNEVKGIRSDENFLAKYMSGAYGGFPNIRV
jgi:AAA15 family ATPase/GTPase